MRTIALLACAAAALAFTPDKVTVDPKYTKDDAYTYAAKLTMSVGGNEVEMNYKYRVNTLKAEEPLDLEGVFSDMKLSVGGNEMDVPVTPLKITQDKIGLIKKVEGGIEGVSAPYWSLLTQFYAPKEGIEKDGTYQYKIEANSAAQQDAIVVDGKYLGPDEKDAALQVFEVKVSEAKTGFEIVSKFWIGDKGRVVKQDGSFKKMFIEVAGADAEGKIKLEKA